MPIGLIIFGDKSHTDLHGSLSVTLITLTLTLFNREARMNSNFDRSIAYLPNLSHDKEISDKKEPLVTVNDEHACLVGAYRSLEEVNEKHASTCIKGNGGWTIFRV